MVTECHLRMPLVHWLPKNRTWKMLIFLFTFLSFKPLNPVWPEVEGKTLREEAEVYYHYLNNKTFYRDNRFIKNCFESNGFEAVFYVKGIQKGIRNISRSF
jgi:hypothetical protein